MFIASLLGTEHEKDSVENMPASLVVLSLDKTLNGISPSLCGTTGGGAKQSTRLDGPV